MNSLYAPSFQHGWLEKGDTVGVHGLVQILQDFLHSVQQLCGLWYFGPAVLPYVLFGGIGWMDTTEPIGILEPLYILLIHHREGCGEELAESAEQRVMLRGALP